MAELAQFAKIKKRKKIKKKKKKGASGRKLAQYIKMCGNVTTDVFDLG